MMTKENCKYCNLIRGASNFSYDAILHETESFIVIPSKGALVRGWQLVVPKRHVLNALQLSSDEKKELVSLVQERAYLAQTTYGKEIAIFEHGAISENSLVGCGIDHAHIHIVPINQKIKENFTAECNTEFEKLDFASIYNFYENYKNEENKHYWIYALENQPPFFSNKMTEKSQFFRRVIADAIGKNNEYDYKTHLHLDNIEDTVNDFNALNFHKIA